MTCWRWKRSGKSMDIMLLKFPLISNTLLKYLAFVGISECMRAGTVCRVFLFEKFYWFFADHLLWLWLPMPHYIYKWIHMFVTPHPFASSPPSWGQMIRWMLRWFRIQIAIEIVGLVMRQPCSVSRRLVSKVLFHFVQFGLGCDLWPGGQNFGTGQSESTTQHVSSDQPKFSAIQVGRFLKNSHSI